MEPNTPANSIPVPSLSTETGNAILSAFLDASTPIEHIAQEFSLTVGTLLAWLRQHASLIAELTSTLEQRAKILALRVEVIAMDTLRQIAELSRDPEARRKAASKLLSHIKRTPGASPGPHAPSPCSTTVSESSARATNVAGSAASLVPPPIHSNTHSNTHGNPPQTQISGVAAASICGHD